MVNMKGSNPDVYMNFTPLAFWIVIEREPDEILDAPDEEERDRAPQDQSPDTRDQPLPELIEMIQKRHLRARVFDVGVGQMDVSVVVIGRRFGGTWEGHERHSFRVRPC